MPPGKVTGEESGQSRTCVDPSTSQECTRTLSDVHQAAAHGPGIPLFCCSPCHHQFMQLALQCKTQEVGTESSQVLVPWRLCTAQGQTGHRISVIGATMLKGKRGCCQLGVCIRKVLEPAKKELGKGLKGEWQWNRGPLRPGTARPQD